MRDFKEEVRIFTALRALVDDHGRGQQMLGRNLRDIETVASGNPVDRRIKVRAYMLSHRDIVPIPGGPALIVAAHLMQRESSCINERKAAVE